MWRDSFCSGSTSSRNAGNLGLRVTIATLLLGSAGVLIAPTLPGPAAALAERASPGRPNSLGTGDLYAIVVGVSKYREPRIPRLDNADRDALAFGEFLADQNRVFKETRVIMLINEKATKSEVERHLYYTLPKAGKDDTIILFFSGHGAYDTVRTKDLFFLTHDADPDHLLTSAVKMSGLDFLKAIEAERVVIVADACHSGGFSQMRAKVAQGSRQRFLEEAQKSSGRVIIMSGREDQFSWEVANQKQSVFTQSLIQGLKGKADKDHDGLVTLSEAYEYAYNLTRERSLGRQHPQLEGKVSGSFPLSYVGRAAPVSELKQQVMVVAEKGDAAQMDQLIASGGDVNVRDDDNDTPLIRSARNGHLDVVKLLLGRGADVDARNHTRATALSAASENGHVEVARALLTAGADVESRTTGGATPLALAAKNGHLETARVLLAAGADVKARSETGKTPLGIASAEGHTEMVQLLIERGSDAEARDLDGGTPLIHAACRGRAGVVKFLLSKGARVTAGSNRPLENELLLAALLDDLPRVKELLELGAGIDAETEAGDTPLTLAVGLGHLKLMKFLIQMGANVNLKTRSHTTALLLASRVGLDYIVEALLAGRAYVHSQDAEGNTALMLAARNSHPRIVRILLAHEADPNVRNRKGCTALMLAAESGDAETVRELLAAGAEVNASDSDGNTALMMSARKGNSTVVRTLCRKDVDVNGRNIKGSTALLLAAANGHVGVVKTLLARGAQPGVRDWEGRTALTIAAEAGQTEVVELLRGQAEDPSPVQN